MITRLEEWRTALDSRQADEREPTGDVRLDQLIVDTGDRIGVCARRTIPYRNQNEARSLFEATLDVVVREAEQTRFESRASHDVTRTVVREAEDRLSVEIQQC